MRLRTFAIAALVLCACAPVPLCGPANCPGGCCDASGRCTDGTTALSCGANGQACAICRADQACMAGTCLTNSMRSAPDAGTPSDAGSPTPDAGAADAGTGTCGTSGTRGAPCQQSSDCCAAEGDICQGPFQCCPAGRAGLGVSCAGDSDCCSGTCGTSSTGSSFTCCSSSNAACLSDGDCCWGMACRAGVGFGMQTCCVPPGTTAAGRVCCPGSVVGSACEPLNGTTGCAVTSDMCCIPGGNSCARDQDCCEPSGTGGGTQCFNGTCCFSFGSQCTSSAQCCGGTCSNGTCN